jgi:hypothetical protein
MGTYSSSWSLPSNVRLDHAMLGGHVRDRVREPHGPEDRGHVHDRPAPALAHRADLGARAVEDAVEVHPHHRPPAVEWVIAGGCSGTADPGVVHADIEATEPADRGGHHRLDLIGIGDVGPIGRGPAARRLDLARDAFSSCGIDVGHEHARPSLGEKLGARLTDPRASTGHDRDVLAGVGFAIAFTGWMLVMSVFLVFIGLPMFFFGLAVMQAQER